MYPTYTGGSRAEVPAGYGTAPEGRAVVTWTSPLGTFQKLGEGYPDLIVGR